MSLTSLTVARTLELLAVEAARSLGCSLRAAIATRGYATLAVSGGSTPALLFDVLAAEPLDWGCVHVLQVDERIAPPSSRDRNLVGLRASLLDRVGLPESNLHAMPADPGAPSMRQRAAAYEEVMQLLAPHGLDVVHLGIGDDGHTASLVPGDPALHEQHELVTACGLYNGYERLTLTYPAINAAREVLWLAAGANKASRIRQLLSGDTSIPAGRVTTPIQRGFFDDAAFPTLDTNVRGLPA